MNKGKRRTTWMQLQVSLIERIAFSGLIMAALILVVYYFKIPDPNMVLLTGLILCSALFGFVGGIVAAVIMTFYTLFYFSVGNSFIHFEPQELGKAIVSLVVMIADMLLVCMLKREVRRTFTEVDTLTDKLHSENEHLQTLSFTDALTGIQNRLALRQEYGKYQNCEVTAVMMDVDKFKSINDTRGHEEGDRILKETARLLSEAFGVKNCFRYGGDEFLVICPQTTEEEVLRKLESVKNKRPFLENGDTHERVEYSYGCASGKLDDPRVLRELFSAADERMYEMKREKKTDTR